MDKKQQLLGVKREILDNLIPLVIDGDGDSAERASTALSIVEFGNASIDLYEKTLAIIKSVEDTELKTDFLMRLLGNVQLDLSTKDVPEVAPSGEEAATISTVE